MCSPLAKYLISCVSRTGDGIDFEMTTTLRVMVSSPAPDKVLLCRPSILEKHLVQKGKATEVSLARHCRMMIIRGTEEGRH